MEDEPPVDQPILGEKEDEKKNNLSYEERIELVAMLLGMSFFGPLPHGAVAQVAKKFNVTRATASRIWNSATLSRESGRVVVHEIASKKKGFCGRKKKWDEEAVKEAVAEVPLKLRKTWRSLSAQLSIPSATLFKMKQTVLVRHSNSLKPTLKDHHLISRIEYCLSMRDSCGLLYRDMLDTIHVDEKWFFMTSENECYILAEGEEPPHRHIQHKGFINKVMFLCAVARPRMVNGRMWDGKIGIFPIGRVEPAQRASANRPRGAAVWKNETVDRNRYRRLLIEEVLPKIKEKFPREYLHRRNNLKIRIQQDGAKSHILEDDKEWLETLEQQGLQDKIQLFNQPAQSPDLNINDLGFFRSIQSLYSLEAPKDELQLIAAVKESFRKYKPETLNRVWLTHQTCMNEILRNYGSNCYSIPHMGKEQLERLGELPTVVEVAAVAKEVYDVRPDQENQEINQSNN